MKLLVYTLKKVSVSWGSRRHTHTHTHALRNYSKLKGTNDTWQTGWYVTNVRKDITVAKQHSLNKVNRLDDSIESVLNS